MASDYTFDISKRPKEKGQEKLGNIKGVIRSRISKKNRQYNDQKKKDKKSLEISKV
jgi:hypothetical protein